MNRNVLHKNFYMIFWQPKTSINLHLEALFIQQCLTAWGNFKVLMSFMNKYVTC